MNNTERDALLLKMSNKIFNGFDASIERLDKDVRTMRKMLWGLLLGLFSIAIGVAIDVIIHLPVCPP